MWALHWAGRYLDRDLLNKKVHKITWKNLEVSEKLHTFAPVKKKDMVA